MNSALLRGASDVVRPWVTAGLACLLSAIGLLASSGPASAADLSQWDIGQPCPDVLVVGARGSGQERDSSGGFISETPTMGLGAEVHNVAHWLARALDDHGITVGAYANPYPAVDASEYLDDQGLFWSVEQGKLSTRVIVAIVANECGPDTKIVLAGFSQGAWVTREGAPFVQSEHRDRIVALVLIADPQFDPNGGGSVLGDPDPDKGGIAGRVPVAGFLASRTINVCRAGDVVCQSETIQDAVSYGLGGGAAIHSDGYQGLEMGFGAAALAATRILGGSSATGGANVALIVDSSGSMTSNDPTNRRNAAGRAFLNVATGSDALGVVDFDGGATVLSEARNPVTERDALVAALDQIDSSGGTDLGAGLSAGCGVLERSLLAGPKAAVFLTDGDGSYTDEAQCFAGHGWPIFAFGLGSGVNQALLESISTQTGGSYRHLTDATDLICEFQQIRAAMAGEQQQSCAPSGTIEQDQLVTFIRNVAELLRQVTFTVTWPGSEVEMTVVSPSGQRIGPEDSDFDIATDSGPGYQSISIANPEAGEWTVELFGKEVPGESEAFNLSTVSLPGRNKEPVPSFTASPLGDREWSFDAGNSSDPDGTILGYLWSFGDGEIAEGPAPTHRFAQPGQYSVVLTVVDDEGATATTERTVVEEPLPPGPVDSGSASSGVNSAVSPPPPALAPIAPAPQGVGVARNVALVKGRIALLPLRCVGQGPCRGVAKLFIRVNRGKGWANRRGARRSTARKRGRKLLVIGKGRFAVAPGRRGKVRIRLTRTGKRLVRKAGRRGLRARLVGPGLRKRGVKLRQRGQRNSKRHAQGQRRQRLALTGFAGSVGTATAFGQVIVPTTATTNKEPLIDGYPGSPRRGAIDLEMPFSGKIPPGHPACNLRRAYELGTVELDGEFDEIGSITARNNGRWKFGLVFDRPPMVEPMAIAIRVLPRTLAYRGATYRCEEAISNTVAVDQSDFTPCLIARAEQRGYVPGIRTTRRVIRQAMANGSYKLTRFYRMRLKKFRTQKDKIRRAVQSRCRERE